MSVHIVRISEAEEPAHTRRSIAAAEEIFRQFREARDEENRLRRKAGKKRKK